MLPAHAGSGSEAADNGLILISSALVLLMTPGLAFFYGGFVQGRNVLNTMGMSLVMMGIATLVWVSVGFSLAFADGGSMNAVIGDPLHHAMLNNLAGNWDGLTIPGMTFALFQGMFAIITPALISGALVERLSFRFWCLFTPFWLLLVYAPLAHMVWGGGFLGKDLDFAGGSQLAVSGAELPFTTTHVSAATGLVTWALVETWRNAKPTAVGMATGAVAGLVGVTPAAGFITPGAGMAIGAITSACCYASVQLKMHWRFDDSLDTFAVHGVGGTIGALLTGVFASAALIDGHPAAGVLAEQGRFGLILGQLQAVVVAYGIAAIGTLAIALAIRQCGVPFRVSEEAENLGVDISEHGEEAYAERTGSPVLD